ncbi:hypothetical protein FQR65_LT16294 [Abscondita terminalis]|nr:hypothetical protein FQR65_LT16294 [Abscondita terminalis]
MEFDHADLEVKAMLDKHSTFLEFEIKVEGTVQLTCDISNEDFIHPIQNDIKVLKKDLEALYHTSEEVEADQAEENEEGDVDPRWAALNKLKGKD